MINLFTKGKEKKPNPTNIYYVSGLFRHSRKNRQTYSPIL